VGEACGEWEARDSIPFHPKAPAGSTLDRLLRRSGLDRESFRITNVVWAQPPRNWLEGSPWETQAIEAYREHLDNVIREMRPRCIVALGNVALKRLTASGGRGQSITACRGYVLRGDGAWVIPTFHPSYILQGQQSKSGAVIFDLLHAVEIAKTGFERRPVRYVADPTLEDLLAFERAYNPDVHALSYDIETPESGELDEEDTEARDISYNIIRISFCYDGDTGYAISFPWSPPFIAVAKRLLASRGEKRTWNGNNFDNPRLEASGCIINGRRIDAMWGWHFLQPTLPRSLAFVTPFYGWTQEPWKHLNSSQPGYYSAADAHATQLNADGIERDLKRQGQWERYLSHVVDVGEVLTRMGKTGLPYDPVRAKAFGEELQAKYDERYEELQRIIPVELKPVHPKQGYKRVPASTDGMRLITVPVLDEAMNTTTVERWARVEPFLPTSWQQVLAYIKFKKHKPGTQRKTRKETSDEDTLERLWRKHRDPTYNLIIECRQLRKVLGTYVGGWKPGRDGRIHSTPGFWGKMYRISWRNPNIGATIQDKREEYIAAGFRKCVACAPGRVLVEVDWRGIEAVLVGYFAEDSDYMRLAGLGVHSFMALHMAGDAISPSLPDDELRDRFRHIKKTQPKLYDDAKHTIHGTNYGMGPRLMAQLYDMSEKEARRLQELYFGLFPRIRDWQHKTIERASQEARLSNPYGYVMWFWDVYRWNSRQQRFELGEDAKSAVAFLPRDTAAGMLKDAVLRLRPLADDGIMLATAHDAILCECPEREAEDIARRVVTEMERPVPELGGLVIRTEAKMGGAWDKDAMEVIDLGILSRA